MKKSFPSRKNPLMGIVFLALSGGFYLLLGLPFIKHTNPVIIAVWIFILLLFGLIWFGGSYLTDRENLVCKIGPFNERVLPKGDILSIQRSFEMKASSSGPSFKKLKIRYRGGEALITPSREAEFLEALTAVNPKIFIDLTIVTRI